jgi:hypothetical protein
MLLHQVMALGRGACPGNKHPSPPRAAAYFRNPKTLNPKPTKYGTKWCKAFMQILCPSYFHYRIRNCRTNVLYSRPQFHHFFLFFFLAISYKPSQCHNIICENHWKLSYYHTKTLCIYVVSNFEPLVRSFDKELNTPKPQETWDEDKGHKKQEGGPGWRLGGARGKGRMRLRKLKCDVVTSRRCGTTLVLRHHFYLYLYARRLSHLLLFTIVDLHDDFFFYRDIRFTPYIVLVGV